MNPVLKRAAPFVRRAMLDEEAQRRKSGDWGRWVSHDALPLTDANAAKGWAREITKAIKNKVFTVVYRPLPGAGVHLGIASLSGVRPTWFELQRIKNEILGPFEAAVEIYPPQGEVIDDGMTHLWSGLAIPRDFSIFWNAR